MIAKRAVYGLLPFEQRFVKDTWINRSAEQFIPPIRRRRVEEACGTGVFSSEHWHWSFGGTEVSCRSSGGGGCAVAYRAPAG